MSFLSQRVAAQGVTDADLPKAVDDGKYKTFYWSLQIVVAAPAWSVSTGGAVTNLQFAPPIDILINRVSCAALWQPNPAAAIQRIESRLSLRGATASDSVNVMQPEGLQQPAPAGYFYFTDRYVWAFAKEETDRTWENSPVFVPRTVTPYQFVAEASTDNAAGFAAGDVINFYFTVSYKQANPY